MPKYIIEYAGRLVGVEGSSIDRSLARIVGGFGRIELYESMIQHPGLAFIRFYYNLRSDRTDIIDGFIVTGCGNLRFDGDTLVFRESQPNGATYTFETKSRG